MGLGLRRLLILCFSLFLTIRADCSELSLSARVDQNRISLDGTVSLKIQMRAEGGSAGASPELQAPDFEVVNEYNSISMSVQSNANGGFSTVHSQEITKVLHPLKEGNLRISHIQISSGGKTYTAPDIVVQVVKGAVPRAGQQNLRQGVVQRSGRPSAENLNFVRAETDKKTAYKGEQVIVSYYLYHQTQAQNFQVDKFPVLNGFLREDLDFPVMTQRLENEPIEVGGVLYQRSLLAKYAAYPLEKGKLSIDPIGLKFNYMARRGGDDDEDMDPLFNFFQQMAPRVAAVQSDPVFVEVQDLPESGKPATYSGGVGDFQVVSAADKYELHANEAITLTVKVEGHGNLTPLKEPQMALPSGVELYSSKGKAKTDRGGVGEKIFEVLLIPRTPGKFVLPPIEFSFFNPATKQYYTRSSREIPIHVLDPLPGGQLVSPAQSALPQGVVVSGKEPQLELRYLKPPGVASSWINVPTWRLLYWAFSIVLGFFSILVGQDFFRKIQVKKVTGDSRKNWDHLRKVAKAASDGATWQEITEAYEALTGLVFDSLDGAYHAGSRSHSRSDLKQRFVDENGLSESTWKKIEALLEYSELVRFASAAGGVSEAAVRKELPRWVEEAHSITQTLEKPA